MTRMPSLFISHGSPTFATDPAAAATLLRQLGPQLPRPRAIVLLSPHWMTREVQVGFAQAPQTIHDFGGFPQALYQLQYPAPGSPPVAARALALLQADGWNASAAPEQGLDHGAWVPLMHLFPQADVPVVQVSLPVTLDPAGAVRLGRALAPLAEEEVLIIGSGSITHNLSEFRFAAQAPTAAYVTEFVAWIRAALQRQDEAALIHYLSVAPHARRAHPTSDHYLPLPFAWGAAGPEPAVQVIDGGVEFGMLSMDSYLLGGL